MKLLLLTLFLFDNLIAKKRIKKIAKRYYKVKFIKIDNEFLLENKATILKNFKTKTGYVKQYHGFLCDKIVQKGYELLTISSGEKYSEETKFYSSLKSAINDNCKPTFTKMLSSGNTIYFWEYVELEKPIFFDTEANIIHIVLALKTDSNGKVLQEIVTANMGKTGNQNENQAMI